MAQATPWPAATVRDSTAAIVEGAEYQRELSVSVFDRALSWAGAQVERLLLLIPEIHVGPWLLIGLVVLLVVLLVVRAVISLRADREYRAGGVGVTLASPRQDPWLDAERLAKTGAFLAAAQQLCAALLSASSRRGEVTLHPSKTTGDYAREMRRRGAKSEPAFQAFRARYDRIVYDRQACTAEEFEGLLTAAAPLLRAERIA